MRFFKVRAHTKTDLKIHVVWIPKYRKNVLSGEVAIRTRDISYQIILEHEIENISGNVSKNHIHILNFLSSDTKYQEHHAMAKQDKLQNIAVGI